MLTPPEGSQAYPTPILPMYKVEDKGTTSIATRSTKRHIAWLEKEIARLDAEYQEALEKCIPFADRAALYRSVPGVGPLTSATLVAYLPELGCWDSKSLTSLVGLAPWSRDSGKKRGNCGAQRRYTTEHDSQK